MRNLGPLYVITDTRIQDRFDHVELAAKALAGGADVIQLRDKDESTGKLVGIAVRIAELCRRHGAVFIVNDRTDVALAAGADGVHLGRDDLPIEEARRILGRERIIGATASSVAEALEVQKKGADYVGLGHIFPTTTKAKEGHPLGLGAVEEAVSSLAIPIIAVGGIDEHNAAEVMRAGAQGIAVVSAVCGRTEPCEAAAQLKAIVAGANPPKGGAIAP